MAKLKFTVVLMPDGNGYQAFVPHYNDVTTWGETPEEAFANAREVLEAVLEKDADLGQPLPPVTPPGHIVIGEVEAKVPDKLIAMSNAYWSDLKQGAKAKP